MSTPQPAERLLWRLPNWFGSFDVAIHKQLQAYNIELLKFNSKINLISKKTEREADQLHFADSIMASNLIFPQVKGTEVFDLGSGNGFPGVVMAILNKDKNFTFVDSDERKIEFLKHVIATLSLTNAKAIKARIEDLPAGSIETAVCRGFASLTGASLSARRAFKKGGSFYHLKGSSWGREIAEMPSQVCSIWSPKLLRNYRLPESSVDMAVIVCTKIAD